MIKNPWFTLVVGLVLGLTLGYVFAERQPIPPGKALRLGVSPGGGAAGDLPEGHPPLDAAGANPQVAALQQQIADTRGLLASSPDDPGLMVALGDQYFELARSTENSAHWNEARAWYVKAEANGRGDDPNVLTDLAVVYRNLGQTQNALEKLDHAIEIDGEHWQALYNKVIVLNFDLHDHDAAKQTFARLEAVAEANPQVPDLSPIRAEVLGK
ncbi:MAG: tetratricopeptide repeat protein [Thermoanaerobaculales bacterium]|jgi:tetratricopeptide (TPR) repeat protein|nr:tetratricopeptide repeat protein [Thermoanaerobaculales bacterium]